MICVCLGGASGGLILLGPKALGFYERLPFLFPFVCSFFGIVAMVCGGDVLIVVVPVFVVVFRSERLKVGGG